MLSSPVYPRASTKDLSSPDRTVPVPADLRKSQRPSFSSQAEKRRVLNPLLLTLRDTPSCKSFICHSYENAREGHLPGYSRSHPISPLKYVESVPCEKIGLAVTLKRKSFRIRCQFAKSFRAHSYEKYARKSFKAHSYKISAPEVPSNHTLAKRGREGVKVSVDPLHLHAPQAPQSPATRLSQAIFERGPSRLATSYLFLNFSRKCNVLCAASGDPVLSPAARGLS